MRGCIGVIRSAVISLACTVGLWWFVDAADAADDPTAAIPNRAQELLWASNDPGLLAYRRALRLAYVHRPEEPADTPSVTLEDSRNTSPAGSGGGAGKPGVIDRFLMMSWREAGLLEAKTPPARCDDATFCRRVYLDLIGVVPTIEERERFMKDARADKRERLVDELLAREQDYADHWTPFWEDALGSTNVNNQGGVPSRGSYREWINRAFRENRAFDLFAAQLIDTTIPGAQKPMIAEANGKRTRTAYILNETHTMTLQSAAATAQVFMGTAMKCASCHNHFENDEWPQNRFLGFASLFAAKDLERVRCEKHTGEFVAAQFPFEIPDGPGEAMGGGDGAETSNRTHGSDSSHGESASVESRLRRVAQLLIDPTNPRFARAIVNRLWKRYLGLGLVEPVDDFRADVPPSHPELLDWLAYDFMAHDYDLKRTIRLILASRAYQSRYDPALEDHFDVAKKHEMRYFRSPTLRRLTAEQVVDSVRVVTTQKLEPKQRLYLRDNSTPLSRALGRPASRNEISTGRADDVAVVQALELLNGEEFAASLREGALTTGREDGAEAMVRRVYGAILCREPTTEELSAGTEYLRSASERAEPEMPLADATLLDDELPDGAYVGEGWTWVERGVGPVATGTRSHTRESHGKQTQHVVRGLARTPVGPNDVLRVRVHLDPGAMPKQIMVQWNDGGGHDGGWAHRAFWGEDLIAYGQSGTASRKRVGDLPKGGEWVTLEVPAREVGFTPGSSIVGMSFDQVGGTVHWDAAEVVRGPAVRRDVGLEDLAWALFAMAEFQYIR